MVFLFRIYVFWNGVFKFLNDQKQFDEWEINPYKIIFWKHIHSLLRFHERQSSFLTESHIIWKHMILFHIRDAHEGFPLPAPAFYKHCTTNIIETLHHQYYRNEL